MPSYARWLASLMLAVVGAPSTAVVAASAVASEATVVAVAASLVTTAASLMSETAKTTIPAALSALEVTRVTTKALLVRLLRKALTLARGVVGSRSGTARLSTHCRWAGSVALRVAKRLQRVLRGTLLTTLLWVRRALARIALGASEGVWQTSKSTSCGAQVALGCTRCRPAIFAKTSSRSTIAAVHGRLSKTTSVRR